MRRRKPWAARSGSCDRQPLVGGQSGAGPAPIAAGLDVLRPQSGRHHHPRPLYAAFCASGLLLDRPEAPRLGGRIDIEARLFQVGRGRLGSLVALRDADGTVGRVAIVSTFVGRTENGGNRSLARRAPRALALPSETDRALDGLARGAARVATLMRSRAPEGLTLRLTPCPGLDFNAAGLLYFPSFAALADRAEFAAGLAPTAAWPPATRSSSATSSLAKRWTSACFPAGSAGPRS